MKIDRHNYEEYFILYWDNELTTAEKQMVDEFVQANTDLQEEFRIFGETRFAPEAGIQFSDKDKLARKEDAFIHTSNYGEILISCLDGELSPGQKAATENFIATHPAAQKEWAILQKTKLQPDADIVFPDKSVLYRREEKVRVIKMTWFRVAVAAMLLLVAGFVTVRIINTGNKQGKIEIVKQNPPVIQQQKQQPEENQINITARSDKNKTESPGNIRQLPKVIEESKLPGNEIAVYTSGNKNNLPARRLNQDEQVIAANSNDVEEKTDLSTALVSLDKPDYQTIETIEESSDENNSDKTGVTKTATPTFASYTPEKATKEKGGLKEFLRKTTRVFERRTNMKTTTEDNKLLLGVFAVSLK